MSKKIEVTGLTIDDLNSDRFDAKSVEFVWEGKVYRPGDIVPRHPDALDYERKQVYGIYNMLVDEHASDPFALFDFKWKTGSPLIRWCAFRDQNEAIRPGRISRLQFGGLPIERWVTAIDCLVEFPDGPAIKIEEPQ